MAAMLLFPIGDDEVKSIRLRYESYDPALLETLVRETERGKKSGTFEPLLEVARAVKPPALTKTERKRQTERLARLQKLGAPAIIVRPLELNVDPLGALERWLSGDAAADLAHYAHKLAVRDRLDLRHALDFLVWLLEPRMRRRSGWWEGSRGSVERPPLRPADSELFSALHGTARFVVDGVQPVTPSRYGFDLPNNYRPPEELAGLMEVIERARGTPLFEQGREWRETHIHEKPYSIRLMMLDDDTAREREIERLREVADWSFVAEMHGVNRLLTRLEKFVRRAQRRRWGIFAIDALDP